LHEWIILDVNENVMKIWNFCVNVNMNVNVNANEHPAHETADDVVMDASSLPFATSAPLSSTPFEKATAPPPRKRARKIARLVARTATAVSVGAVVTWTALAFS